MNRVAQFEKINYEQFEKDWIDTFLNDEDRIEEVLKIYENVEIPTRKTKYSAGHDISIPFNYTLEPGMTLKIPTGLRCKMEDDYVMLIFPRSSLGINMD